MFVLQKGIQGKLEGEKSRLSAAVAACEAAAACISRPSSPQDPTTAPIPDREIAVRVRLEDLIDNVSNNCKHKNDFLLWLWFQI